MLPSVKIDKQQFFFNFDQTRYIVYCPRSRLAARQPNDVVSVLAGSLMGSFA